MFEAVELGQTTDKATFDEQSPELRERLLDAQLRLRSSARSLVIVISGPEGAGKGETVNLLLEWLDARGVETHALGEPSDEEARRPEFFRFWRRLPPRGRTAIFFGSWYTRPINEHAAGRIDDAELDRSLQRIAEFERMLANEHVLLAKFWLHVTRKQVAKRYRELESNPDTSWRVTKADWDFYERYDEFVAAGSLAIRRTSRSFAPWHLVEAWDKRHRHLRVGELLAGAMEHAMAGDPPAQEPPEPLPVPAAVNVINSLDLSRRIDKDEYERRKDKYQAAIGRQVREMTAKGRSAVLVFEGADAAGKGGCIRRVVRAMDARFYRVVPIAEPTDEERARPYLWRFWRNVPPRGHVTVYDRSWYGRVLVERVEGYAAPSDWKRAYAEINAFEEQLAEAGVIVLKFWLAISPEEQLRRFRHREETGYKRYKITEEDWRNREKWAAYEAAASEAIARTSFEHAPWTLVEAEHKRVARVKVLRTVAKRFAKALE